MNNVWIKYLPRFLHQRIDGRYNLQRMISNAGWLFADRVFRLVVGLFVGIWIARYLGPDQFGLYNYALAFVSLFAPISTLGLDSIVVRDIIRDQSAKDEILGTVFILKLIGGIAMLLLTLTVVSFSRPNENLTQWLVGIVAAGAVFQSFDAIDFWFQSNVRSKYTVYAKGFAFTAVAFLKVALIMANAPLIAFAWAGIAEIMLGAGGLIIAYRVNGNFFYGWKWSYTRARKLLNDSWPLVLSGFAIYIQARIDQVMLGEMIGNAEVGQYAVAMRLIEFFGFVPMIVQSSVAPTITQAKLKGENDYWAQLASIYRLMFLCFLVVAIPLYIFSAEIVRYLYGDAYKEAGILLSLFSIRLLLTNFGVAKSLFITNENLFRYSFVTAFVGALINILLNYLLIPRYAAVGSVWASTASFFVTTFLIDLFFLRTRTNFKIMLMAMVTPWKLNFK